MEILLIVHPLNGFLMIGFPIALGIYLIRRFQQSWWLWWMGAATFVLSQIGHIPFNAALSALFNRGLLPTPPQEWQLPVNALVLGLSAGLWEELMRYATYKWWAVQARSWRQGLVLGAGHGGIEAIIFGGLVLVTFFSMLGLRSADLTNVIPASQLQTIQQQVDVYWNSPWYLSLLGALERALTLPFHLSLSLLVLQSFIRKRFAWVWLAVMWHAASNAAILFVAHFWGALAVEGVLAIFTLFALGIIYVLYQPELTEPKLSEPMKILPVKLRDIEVPADSLDQTRYT